MRVFFKFVFVFFLGSAKSVYVKEASINGTAKQQSPSANRLTNVVSHVFCDSSLEAEDRIAKKTLDEVHTYAELKHDPKASLPDSFTICSTIMTTNCRSNLWPTFFAILNTNRTQFLAAFRNHGSVENFFEILFSESLSGAVISKQPPFFPNQWIRSCMAVDTTSGLIHWVVDGTLILTRISEEVKSSKKHPKDLSKRLILGARSIGGVWLAPSHQVTNLNIFSSALSMEKMKRMTEAGGCVGGWIVG